MMMSSSSSSGGRRLSMNGNIARKLRFDKSLETKEILEWLKEAKTNSQYTILTFDEVTFNASVVAAIIDLFRYSSQYGRMWERLNIEFCEGPIDLIVCMALTMDCIKHLFFASDENQDATMARLCTTLRLNTSLQSMWLLIPFTELSAEFLGSALIYNDTLDKLSLSGSNWDPLGDDDDDSDDDSDDDDDESGDYDDYETGEDTDDSNKLAAAFDRDDSSKRAAFDKSAAPLALAKGLGQNVGLRHVDFSCCYLDDDSMGLLIGSLIGHPNLEVLDISRNVCRLASMEALAGIVGHEDNKLKSLDLREQQTDIRGGNSLKLNLFSQAMYDNDQLETLKLSNNHLQDVQAVELFRQMRGNSTLSELDLQFNLITEKGLSMITRYLQDMPALEVLMLGGNVFGKEALKDLERLQDDDDSICTYGEEELAQTSQKHIGFSGSMMGGELLGDILEE